MPVGMETHLKTAMDAFCFGLPFEIVYHAVNPDTAEIIYEDRTLTVETIPLKHRIPCCGYLFREKPGLRHIVRDMCDAYNVPLSMYGRIKNGEDFITEDGEVIPNSRLTLPAGPVRSYAYCSDTVYLPKLASQLKGVDLLFHEATFGRDSMKRAKETFHTTAAEAAMLAHDAGVKKLMIGHYSARYTDNRVLLDEAREVFADTVLAYEGQVFRI